MVLSGKALGDSLSISRIVLLLIIVFATSACAGLGAGKWSAYSMSVQINSSDGQALAGAKVSSIDNNDVITGSDGLATLYFRTKGLYVITVFADGMETTQIKVTIPTDVDKVVQVFLSPLANQP